MGRSPNTSLSLSKTLERVGLACGSQDMFFTRLEAEDDLDVYATMKVLTGDTEIRQVMPKDVRDRMPGRARSCTALEVAETAAGGQEEEGQEAEGFRTPFMSYTQVYRVIVQNQYDDPIALIMIMIDCKQC